MTIEYSIDYTMYQKAKRLMEETLDHCTKQALLEITQMFEDGIGEEDGIADCRVNVDKDVIEVLKDVVEITDVFDDTNDEYTYIVKNIDEVKTLQNIQIDNNNVKRTANMIASRCITSLQERLAQDIPFYCIGTAYMDHVTASVIGGIIEIEKQTGRD